MIYGKIFKRIDGSYVINDGTYHATFTGESGITGEMVEAYLADHPEALVPEPQPPAPTPEQLKEREIAEKLAYLASTDWYVIRFADSGVAVPDDIKAARAQARSRIDELKGGAL